eukprot:COSAG01_NODE_807_length_13432_cov_2015.466032_5_plen_149_part_00
MIIISTHASKSTWSSTDLPLLILTDETDRNRWESTCCMPLEGRSSQLIKQTSDRSSRQPVSRRTDYYYQWAILRSCSLLGFWGPARFRSTQDSDAQTGTQSSAWTVAAAQRPLPQLTDLSITQLADPVYYARTFAPLTSYVTIRSRNV